MENDLNEVLENGVNDDTLLMKLEAELKAEKENVICDPNKVKKLEKKIKELKEKVNEEQEKTTVDEKKKEIESKSLEDIKKEKEEREEVEEKEQKEEKEQEPDKEDSSTVKAYEDAMQLLHDYRVSVANRQIKDKKLICSQKEFVKDVELEKKKIALKAALTESEKEEIKEKEEALDRDERRAKEPIEREIRERSRKYAEAMVRLHKVNLELAYIHELQEKNKISPEEYAKRKEIALNEQTKIKDEIEKLNPKELMMAMAERNKMDKERERLLGRGYDIEKFNEASKEEKANLKYAEENKLKKEKNLEFAEKEKIENPEQRIEERKQHLENLKKELDNLPEDDIERRMEILMEMEEENALLEHEQEKQARMERGEELDPKEEIRENREIKEEQEEIKEQNLKDYEETREAIEIIEKNEGREVVENPEKSGYSEKIKEEARENAREKGALGGFVASQVIGDEHDTIGEDIAQGVIVGGFIAKTEFEKELHEKTVDVEDPKQAKEYIEKQEAIDELNKNEQAVEKEIRGNI